MNWTKSGYSRRIQRLLKRDGHNCWLCGKPFLMGANPNHSQAPSLDHVLERRNGGWDSYDNLRLAHRSCNSARESRWPNDNHIPKDATSWERLHWESQ